VPTTVAIRYIVHQFLLKQEHRQAHSGKQKQKAKQTKRKAK
jgi:hypothetical protein